MIGSFVGSYAFARRPFRIASPTNLQNGFVWLNADYGSIANFGTALTDGATVTTWKDVYAGAHDANKAGNSGVKPVWKSNIQNGYGIVRFDGSNDSLNINPVNSPSPSLQGAGAFTLFVVAKASTLSGTRCLTTADTGGFKINYDGTNWGVAAAAGTGISTVTGNTTSFHLFTVIFDGSQTGNANRLKFRYDGVQETLNFGATTVGTATNASATYFYIGEDNGASYFGGDIAEIVLYVRAFNALEIAAEENYLKTHWGLTI